MSVKIVHEDTFKTIMSAVNKLVDFVKPTFGPAANKAIISKPIYRMVVDDGVQIARDFELEDDAEDAVVKVVKEVAIRTNDRVGDGTTSSLILVQAIMQEIAKLNKKDGRQITNELKKGAEEAKTQLMSMAKKISTKADLERVARISYDNPEVSLIIADMLNKLGTEGSITMDNSNTMKTFGELTEGIELKQGFISPYMITDNQRMEAILEKPYVLITSYRLTNANDIIPLMTKMMQQGKRELLVICDNIESDALATAIINRVQGKFICVAIQAPQGENKKQMLEDLCIMTGATMFSEVKGNRTEFAEITDLGRAERAVIRSGMTVIVGGRGDKKAIKAEQEGIRAQLATNPRESERIALEERLAFLLGKVGVIKVGAPTEPETKALKYKIEDAVHATKSALKSGIVRGAGLALAELKTSSPILNSALKRPLMQLIENCGVEHMELEANEAYNIVSGQKGDYMKVGVIDPAEVLVAGIESAVSIASMLVTTHGILVEERPKDNK